mgnify:CR=1 FL=1
MRLVQANSPNCYHTGLNHIIIIAVLHSFTCIDTRYKIQDSLLLSITIIMMTATNIYKHNIYCMESKGAEAEAFAPQHLHHQLFTILS